MERSLDFSVQLTPECHNVSEVATCCARGCHTVRIHSRMEERLPPRRFCNTLRFNAKNMQKKKREKKNRKQKKAHDELEHQYLTNWAPSKSSQHVPVLWQDTIISKKDIQTNCFFWTANSIGCLLSARFGVRNTSGWSQAHKRPPSRLQRRGGEVCPCQ